MTALVTGASGGLGAAIASVLAAMGQDVAVHYRGDAVGARRTADEVRRQGQRAHLVQLDLDIDDPDELDAACAGLIAECVDALGPLDAVVLNAFPQWSIDAADLDTAAWDRYHRAGLRPTTALLAAASDELGPGGSAVVIGSIEGYRAAPGHQPYAVAKAALHHLVAAKAYELGPRGIRVVGVAPGLVDRPDLRDDWPEGVRRWSAASALGRPVTAAEVAAVVAFAASPAASGLTGVTIPVDAGWSAAPGW